MLLLRFCFFLLAFFLPAAIFCPVRVFTIACSRRRFPLLSCTFSDKGDGGSGEGSVGDGRRLVEDRFLEVADCRELVPCLGVLDLDRGEMEPVE